MNAPARLVAGVAAAAMLLALDDPLAASSSAARSRRPATDPAVEIAPAARELRPDLGRLARSSARGQSWALLGLAGGEIRDCRCSLGDGRDELVEPRRRPGDRAATDRSRSTPKLPASVRQLLLRLRRVVRRRGGTSGSSGSRGSPSRRASSCRATWRCGASGAAGRDELSEKALAGTRLPLRSRGRRGDRRGRARMRRTKSSGRSPSSGCRRPDRAERRALDPRSDRARSRVRSSRAGRLRAVAARRRDDQLLAAAAREPRSRGANAGDLLARAVRRSAGPAELERVLTALGAVGCGRRRESAAFPAGGAPRPLRRGARRSPRSTRGRRRAGSPLLEPPAQPAQAAHRAGGRRGNDFRRRYRRPSSVPMSR